MEIITGSIDEILAHMEKSGQEADQRVQPWQATCKPGDKFLRIVHQDNYVICIYGEIIDEIQLEKQLGASEEELWWQKRQREAPHMKNYRFTKSYSELCPEGEYGDVHVSTIETLLPDRIFNQAREQNWPSDKERINNLLRFDGKGGVG